MGLITVSGFAGAAIWQLRQANINEIIALSNSAEAQLASGQELDALITGLKAGRKIQDNKLGVDTDTKIKVMGSLQNIFNQVKEFNRLESHTDGVESVAFSPEGKIIASAAALFASDDNTIKLWNLQGELLATLSTLSGHTERFYNVVFSPDRRLIASTNVVFSPDGRTFVSAHCQEK